MISDTELLKWIKNEYGEKYANEKFLKMARKIYEEKVLGKKSYKSDYKKVNKIEEIKIAGKYEVEGIIVDLKINKYIGCPKCYQSKEKGHKLDCDCDEFVDMMIADGVISDGADVKFKYFAPKDRFNLENHKEYKMKGYIKPLKMGEEYIIYIDETINDEKIPKNIETLLSRIKSMDGQRIPKKMLAKYCKENGININDVLSHLIKEGDYYKCK
jgi:hypothetical protein